MKTTRTGSALLRLSLASAVVLSFAACDRAQAPAPGMGSGSSAGSAPGSMTPPATGTTPMPGASAASN